MENESNYIGLLENYEILFNTKIEKEDIAEYYSELCLNIPAIYLILGRLKDLEDLWDTIQDICENRKAYDLTLAKFRLMQASIRIKFKTHFSQMDIDKAGEFFVMQDMKNK